MTGSSAIARRTGNSRPALHNDLHIAEISTMKPDNIFADIPDNLETELFERLAGGGQVTIERIISRGHASPASGWYDQETSEWVIVLRGEARLSFEDRASVLLRAGDYLNLPAHRKHRVDWTAPDRETVWLTVHYHE